MVLEQRPFRTPKVSDMSSLSPKKLCLALLTQKRLRMLRLTQRLFGYFRNSVSYTDEIASGIRYFLDIHRDVGNLLGIPASPS